MRPFAALIHIYVPIPLAAPCAAAQTDANLSAHLHRLPTPPPYLRRMRLLPGRGVQVLDGKCCCCLAWVPFLQITFHAGCRHTHFWQGVAWMVRPICAHRARYRKLIVWLLDIYILEACAVIFRKAIVMLPEANFLSPWCEFPPSRAQNRGIGVFVLGKSNRGEGEREQ